MMSSHETYSDPNPPKVKGKTSGQVPPNNEYPPINYGQPHLNYPIPYNYQNYYPYPGTPDYQPSPSLDPNLPYVYVPYPGPHYNEVPPNSHPLVSGNTGTTMSTTMSTSTSAGHNLSPSLSGNSSPPSSPQSHPLSPGTTRPTKNRRYPRQPRPPYTTNVYIHGLPPSTTDEVLYNMCSSYGLILSSKSIIDPKTQACRGYGFVMYEHLHQAQHAIYCLGVAGFEASFAKVRSPGFVPDFRSLHPPQSNLQDQTSNLYLTNLPLDYTEEKLQELFSPYQVISVRVMRDQQQQSRGVGFARMPDRASAQAALEALDGAQFGQDVLKIKFADIPTSKRPRHYSSHPTNSYPQVPTYPDERSYNYGYPPCYALGYTYPPYGFPGGFYPGMTYYPHPVPPSTEETSNPPPSDSYPDVDDLTDLIRDKVHVSDPTSDSADPPLTNVVDHPTEQSIHPPSPTASPSPHRSPRSTATYPIPPRVPVA